MRSLHTRRFVSTGFENARFFADDAFLAHTPIRVGRFHIGYSSGHSRIQFSSEVKMNPKHIAAMWLLYRRRRIKRNYWVHPIHQKREQIGIFHTLSERTSKG
ncbi:hypothetical protein AVEN_85817-1 [Araneus ventricosus]|uniref:Uncharacterized protein n=1 Tax=Araneus ventricosus TaxID=182803 RepID=A0A4Y2U6R8_ARAVE|nr:hypothetical protein AVEN_85817-1 [Araneus ventricosus]